MAVFICQGCGAEHAAWDGKCPQCGTTETIRLAQQGDRMVDRVIKGKFKIIRKLGQGGMGAVYLAEQVGIGHRVALKFLKSEFSADPEVARRFLNEAKSYARVAHPNAVALHDFGQDEEGNLFIAMEFCEGVDLKKVIAEQGRLPLTEAAEIVLQVADVLANAHSKGVIHRDLKPENIMIRRGMRGVHAKVLDFGIARLMGEGTRLTMAGSIAGTPRYMSPEQVEGRDVDLRADIYSLGIVLYESLTGKQPFDGATITEILRKQVVEPMPHLVEASADLDIPALDQVIQRACAKRREDRWPDLLTFANALSQAIPTQAHLGLSPLQRSGVHPVLGQATPAPGQVSGIAPPDSPLNPQDATANTMLHGQSAVTAPVQLTQPAGAVTGLAPEPSTHPGAPPGLRLNATLAPSEPPPVAPRSNGPLVAVVVVGLAIIGVGGWFLLSGGGTPSPTSPSAPIATPTQPPVRVDPVPAVKPAAPVEVSPAQPAVPVAEAVRELKETTARNALSQGKTEFEVARLDAAETYLKSVEAGTAAHEEAQSMLGKIDAVRAALKEGARLRASGRCDLAITQFEKALALNPRIPDAAEGRAACRQGTIDTTMQ